MSMLSLSAKLCEEIAELPDRETLRSWIEEQASKHKLPYLLAHADDGVIWGRFDAGKLKIASEVNDRRFNQFPALRLNTLQQCRIFGPAGEIFLWKRSGEFKARGLLEPEKAIGKENIISEQQLLWGTHGVVQCDSFTLLRDGAQGLKHAVPVAEGLLLAEDTKLAFNKPCLKVNHYIEYDEDGLARISLSRLVDLGLVDVKSSEEKS